MSPVYTHWQLCLVGLHWKHKSSSAVHPAECWISANCRQKWLKKHFLSLVYIIILVIHKRKTLSRQRPIVLFPSRSSSRTVHLSQLCSLSHSLLLHFTTCSTVLWEPDVGFLYRWEAVAEGTWWGSTMPDKSLRTVLLRRHCQKHELLKSCVRTLHGRTTWRSALQTKTKAGAPKPT